MSGYQFTIQFLRSIDELAFYCVFEPLGDCLKLRGFFLLPRTIILVGSLFGVNMFCGVRVIVLSISSYRLEAGGLAMNEAMKPVHQKYSGFVLSFDATEN